jgi:adenosylmethionine-8-amino-7-oxononanoate aminotransferase
MFTIRGGYHGDTFSCLSLCDPDGGMPAMYGGVVQVHG